MSPVVKASFLVPFFWLLAWVGVASALSILEQEHDDSRRDGEVQQPQ